MIFFLILVVLVFVAQIVEFFIPPLDWMFNAHIYIVPVIVFLRRHGAAVSAHACSRLCRGFPMGRDDRAGARREVEISFGWSILLYAVLAAIMHGLRPLFVRGRWEVHCIMSGVCTSLILLAQYLMISLSARLHPF